MQLHCTNCDAAFDGDPNARCPKCLRRTSVAQATDRAAAPREGAPAPWPDGTRCPLCLEQDVSAAIFHVEIEKGAPSGAEGVARTVTVRCRCCDSCRARVVRLARVRWAVLPFVAFGTVAWPASMVTDHPERMLGLTRLALVVLTTLSCVLVVGVPLVLVDRANASLRRNLEASWLFHRLQARLQRTNDVTPSWKLLADAPAGATVIEATELLAG